MKAVSNFFYDNINTIYNVFYWIVGAFGVLASNKLINQIMSSKDLKKLSLRDQLKTLLKKPTFLGWFFIGMIILTAILSYVKDEIQIYNAATERKRDSAIAAQMNQKALYALTQARKENNEHIERMSKIFSDGMLKNKQLGEEAVNQLTGGGCYPKLFEVIDDSIWEKGKKTKVYLYIKYDGLYPIQDVVVHSMNVNAFYCGSINFLGTKEIWIGTLEKFYMQTLCANYSIADTVNMTSLNFVTIRWRHGAYTTHFYFKRDPQGVLQHEAVYFDNAKQKFFHFGKNSYPVYQSKMICKYCTP